jgi:hypothetical protein
MAEEVLSPARRTLEAQLNTVRFLSGVEEDRWEVLLPAWPHLYVRVTGRDPETGRIFSHDFHLECDGTGGLCQPAGSSPTRSARGSTSGGWTGLG